MPPRQGICLGDREDRGAIQVKHLPVVNKTIRKLSYNTEESRRNNWSTQEHWAWPCAVLCSRQQGVQSRIHVWRLYNLKLLKIFTGADK